ncbi:MAG TPA: antitoxin [Phycisphaerae bacterium]|nr:antitoxin [Phycisphaerae bacterium]
MSRISIDVTPEEHQKLKALAALQGKSIKEFVLESTLGVHGSEAADRDLAELESILDERIQEARTGAVSCRTVGEIFQEVYKRDG